MKDVMGIIYTDNYSLAMRELTTHRCIAALPVAGRYRMVDFFLSNFVNSGVRNVGIITQRNYRSLMDHLGGGKEWDLHTRNNGLFILPPFINRDNAGEYEGMLDGLRANVDYLRHSKQEYVAIVGSRIIFNYDFTDFFRTHEETKADVTLLYTHIDNINTEYSHSSEQSRVFLDVDADGKVKDMEIDPNVPSFPNYAMNVVILKRTLLIHLTDQAYARGYHDFYADLLRPYIAGSLLDVRGYEFKGYARRIETISGYYNFSMDLLKSEVREELFNSNPVYTKVRDEAPARYLEGAKVSNSLIADGCVIEGTVENSILFRGVHIGRDTVVRNSVLMQDDDILDSVELDSVILDKDVTIRSHGRLIGQTHYPIVIGKNVTL